MSLAPIVLFVYNRPYHTVETVQALQQNILANESDLFIYSDAERDNSDKKKVAEVRKYIHSIKGFKNITIIEREKNFGLAANIINGVTEVVNTYKKIIVLEDDLVTSPIFLKYMNDALKLYERNKSVMHISGYKPNMYKSDKKHFFLLPTSCWGWGTWKESWNHFMKDSEYFINKFNKKLIKKFNIDNTYNYYKHILKNYDKKIDTWAIFWYASCFFNNGISLHPAESYVKNIGHDASGVHSGLNTSYDVTITTEEFEFPGEIKIETKDVVELKKFYKRLNGSFLSKIIKKGRKLIT